jgi:hypothetical protein
VEELSDSLTKGVDFGRTQELPQNGESLPVEFGSLFF